MEQKQDIGNAICKGVVAGLNVPEYAFSELFFKFMKDNSDITTHYTGMTANGAVWTLEFKGKTYAVNIMAIPTREEL